MKTNWVYKTTRYLKKVYFRNDRRVAAYLICVGIATCFWFLNALNKTYTVKMAVPVSYINLPDNKILDNQLPEKFDLTIRAHGFNILRHQVSFIFMPFQFNVNDMTNDRMLDRNRDNFAFPSRQFLTEISNQFSNEMDILSMNPDTLVFKFGKMGRKMVKVKSMVQVDLKKQHQISGEIKTIPDSVLVSGPQSALDTIYFTMTDSKRFNTVDQTVAAEVSLQKMKEVFFSPPTVEVYIPVEEYTEAQLLVPLTVKDQAPGVDIKLFPEKVKITFQVGLSRFQAIKPEDFRLSVAFPDISQGKQRLKVSIDTHPDYLYDLKISPDEIEYLIQN